MFFVINKIPYSLQKNSINKSGLTRSLVSIKRLGLPQAIPVLALMASVLIFCCFELTAQITMMNPNADSLHGDNSFSIGTDKLVSTILFYNTANIDQDFLYLKFRLNHHYSGSTIKGLSGDFRDNEKLNADIDLKIYKNLFAIVRSNWVYSSVSKQVALSKFEKLNGTGGLRMNFLEGSYVELSGGKENNVQVGQRFSGSTYNMKSEIRELNLNDFILTANAGGNYSSLSDDRINSDFDGNASFGRRYDSANAMALNLRYRVLNADYFNPPSSKADRKLSFENRYDERLFADALLDFSFTKEVLTNLRFSFGSSDVQRQYKNIIPDITQTKIKKQISDNQFALSGGLKYISTSFSQSLGMSFSTRAEKNSIHKKDFIPPNEVIDLLAIETYSDFNSANTSLFTQTRWAASKRDVLQLDYSVSISRYDTPSKTNYFDKDEFSTNAVLVYLRKISSIIDSKINAELNMNHIVYLKAQKSSDNVWKRNIRLSPQIVVKTESFRMEPQFEVLANYLVYDFSSSSAGEKSFSLRQISYLDTIYIRLPENFSLQAKITSRYSEKGILYWKEFAESVQNSNFEQFVKLLLFVNLKSKFFLGFGGRIYYLSQKMKENAGGLGLPDYSLISRGPEMILSYGIGSLSSVYLQGWYEIQNANRTGNRMFPNFTLNMNLKL